MFGAKYWNDMTNKLDNMDQHVLVRFEFRLNNAAKYHPLPLYGTWQQSSCTCYGMRCATLRPNSNGTLLNVPHYRSDASLQIPLQKNQSRTYTLTHLIRYDLPGWSQFNHAKCIEYINQSKSDINVLLWLRAIMQHSAVFTMRGQCGQQPSPFGLAALARYNDALAVYQQRVRILDLLNIWDALCMCLDRI